VGTCLAAGFDVEHEVPSTDAVTASAATCHQGRCDLPSMAPTPRYFPGAAIQYPTRTSAGDPGPGPELEDGQARKSWGRSGLASAKARVTPSASRSVA
jgi:hypothetical protein